MGVADAILVFRLEFRRYLRWRPLRRQMLGWVGAGGLLAVALTLALWAYPQQNPLDARLARLIVGWILLSFPAWAGFTAVFPLMQKIAQDATRGGELTDLYLTELSPLGIALGKALACWTLAGLLMATCAPYSVAGALWLNIPLQEWLVRFGIGWITLFLLCGVVYRFQWRLPTAQATRMRLSLNLPTAALVGLLLWVVWSLLMFIPLQRNRALSGVPIFHQTPFGALTHALDGYDLFGTAVPAWAVICLFSMLGGLTLLVASAQWLGWWSEAGYRFQRVVGGALFLGMTALCTQAIATHFARGAHAAESLLLYSCLMGATLTALLGRAVFGYYALPKHAPPPQPRTGVLREWLLYGMAAAIIAAVFIESVQPPLDRIKLGALVFYASAWLAAIQALLIDEHAPCAQTPAPAMRAAMETSEYGSGCLISFTWMITLISNSEFQMVVRYLLLPTPLGGLLGIDYPAWAHLLYGLYTLALAWAIYATRKRVH